MNAQELLAKMNAQELLAKSLIEAGQNPRLDALVVQHAQPLLHDGVELFFVDRGLGPQHIFPLCEGDKRTDTWMFYVIQSGDPMSKRYVYGSNALPTEADEEAVSAEVGRAFAEFNKGMSAVGPVP